MKNLQEIINQRAERRLNNDIDNYIKSVQDLKFFEHIENIKIDNGKASIETIRTMFWSQGSAVKTFREKLLPEYIAEESRAFMEKVERLSSEVNDLMNINEEKVYE